MKTKEIKATFSIRFRRWSRAGYAIFCSLACAVTIGCVCVSISDKSLQKAVGVSKDSLYEVSVETESPDKLSELLELEATIQQIQEITLLENQSVSAVVCQQKFKYLFINQNG